MTANKAIQYVNKHNNSREGMAAPFLACRVYSEPLDLPASPAGSTEELYLPTIISDVLLIGCLLSRLKPGLLEKLSLSPNVRLKALQKTQRGNEHMFASLSTQKLPT